MKSYAFHFVRYHYSNLLVILTLLFAFSLTTYSTVAAQDTSKPTEAETQQFWAGTGKSIITPEEPMWMAGYASRTTPFQEVLMDIWAKALVIRDAQGTNLVLITLDLVGIDKGLADEICQKLQSKYSLQRSQISIATSHTHSGPVVGKNLRAMHFYQLAATEQTKISNYSNQLVSKIESAVEEAFKSMQPVDLRWSESSTSFATNRRNNAEAEVPRLRSEGKLKGPVDHAVPVLAAYSKDKQPIAIVFGYACHSTVLSLYKICGDYPGFAQAELERRFPTATAFFWAGCGADINPLPRRTEALAELYGRQLATTVEAVLLTETMKPVKGSLAHHFSLIPLKLDKLPTNEELKQQTESKNIYEAMRAKLLLEQVKAGQPLSPTYDYPIQSWRLGDGPSWVQLGGEVVIDYSLRIKSEQAGRPVWVTSYANDVMAYIPSERVLSEGGYEGTTSMIYYGLPTTWATGVEQAVMDEINRQLKP